MEDVTSLVLKVESGQVGKASRELDKLSGSSVKAEKTTDKVTKAFTRLLGPLLATISAYKGLQKLVSVTREFDILNAQLITATGSAENAAIAFEAIQDFATNTPFQLQEVTEAFLQLVNRGLDPSEESLTNLGNLAAATGKDFNALVTSVAQAGVGEFESLKSLGFSVKTLQDSLKITFRGTTTEIEKGGRAMQDYFNTLAEDQFAGAMTERMGTLDGALSNLQDAWDKLFLSVSQKSPIGDAIEGTVRKGIKFLEMLEEKVRELGGEETRGVNELVSSFDRLTERLKSDDLDGRVLKSLRNQMVGVTDGLKDFSEAEIQLARVQNSLAEVESQRARLGRTRRAPTEAQKEQQARLDALIAARKQTISDLETQIALESELNETQKDRLKGFGIEGEGDQGPSAADLRAEDAFEKLRVSLLTEEEAIQESYEKRKQIILDSTLTTEDEKARIMGRLEKAHAEEIRQFEIQRWNTALSSFDDFQNNLLVLARTGNSELAAIYKAAAIANTVIKTYESATAAYAAMAGIPIVGPALGAAAAGAAIAAGLANVSAISNQQVGNYASGGIVPGNSFNGDNLNAGVNSGEMILNFSQQKQLLDMASGKGGGSKPVVVNVQNFGTSDVEVTEEDAGEERIINIAVGRAKKETKRELASEIRTGQGDVSRSMESSYNLKRGTA